MGLDHATRARALREASQFGQSRLDRARKCSAPQQIGALRQGAWVMRAGAEGAHADRFDDTCSAGPRQA